jgi:hypothetical protein
MSPAAVDAARQRLERSRQRLRQQLLPPPDDAGAQGHGAVPRRWRAWLRAGPLRPLLRALDPWLGGARRTAQRWWRRHPWRPSLELVGGSLHRELTPWVRRHPIGAVGLGAAAGAALVVAAPWRAASVRHALQRSGARVRRWAWHQLTSPAVQTLVAGALTSWLATQAQTAPSPADAGLDEVA